jgi:hypothetical protein
MHKCDGCPYKGEHREMGFRPVGVCYKYTNLTEAERAYNAEVCPLGSVVNHETFMEIGQQMVKGYLDGIGGEHK